MRYILTGTYGNGDLYAEAADSIEMLAYIIGTITQFDHDNTSPEQRVLAASVKVMTEDE